MTVIKEIQTILSAETDDYQRDLDKAAKQAEKFKKSQEDTAKGTKKFSGELGAMKAAFGAFIGTAALLKGAQMLADFGKASIMAAADTEEMRSKFNVVFKDAAGTVERELQRFGDAVGRSRYDLMGFAATLQDTFVPLGFARDQAAEMSVQVTQLAVDLASFNNLNTADVVRDLQSALVGNTETLRKYGVVANDAAVKAEALRSGLWNGTGEMTAQTKAAAILNLTIAGTSDAQGDAARTSDSFTNQMRAAEDAVKDMKIAVGTALIPTIQKAIPVIRDLANEIRNSVEFAVLFNDANEKGLISLREKDEILKKMRDGTVENSEWTKELTDRLFEYSNVVARTAREEEFRNQYMKQTADLAPEAAGAIKELADETENAAQMAALARQKTDDWLGALDTGIESTISTFMKDVEFFTRGGGEIQTAFANLKEGFLKGEITPAEAQKYAGELLVVAENLQGELDGIDTEEVGKSIQEHLGGSLDEALAKIEEVRNQGTFEITSRINVIITTTRQAAENYKTPDERFPWEFDNEGATGLNFMVPPGFNNDNYLVGVSSGEHVAVTPAAGGNLAGSGGGDQYIFRVNDSKTAALAAAEIRRLKRRRFDQNMGLGTL